MIKKIKTNYPQKVNYHVRVNIFVDLFVYVKIFQQSVEKVLHKKSF